VNPYRTAEWVAKHIPRSEHDAYAKRRQRFVEALRTKGLADLSIGGGSNQIGKARLDLAGASVSEARRAIAHVINRVAVHIDDILGSN
jgi:hypothetical protein